MSRLDFSPSNSSALIECQEALPAEETLTVVPPRGSRLLKLSSSFVTAFYLGVHTAVSQANLSSSLSVMEVAENATSRSSVPDDSSRQAILEVLSCQPPEELQDGMTVELGMKLAACIRDFGDACLADLAVIALKGQADPDALSHALRWVGRLPDPASFHGRGSLLIRALDAPSAVVRDGAGLGLVELGLPAAVPALTAAISRESHSLLRQDLEQARAYLSSRP